MLKLSVVSVACCLLLACGLGQTRDGLEGDSVILSGVGGADPGCTVDAGPVCRFPANATLTLEGPEKCAAAKFTCVPPDQYFGNDCGCGCAPPLDGGTHNPDGGFCYGPTAPGVRYAAMDLYQCQLLDFVCDHDERYFSDDCGCGCIEEKGDGGLPTFDGGTGFDGGIDPGDAGAPACVFPPNVNVLYTDTKKCAAAFIVCPPPEKYFSNACGCGCVTP